MAEFRLTEGIDAEIAALQTAGSQLAVTASAVSPGGLSLTTSTKFVEQHEQIAALLAEYRELIRKDTVDLQAMARNVRAVDSKIAANT